MKTTKSVLDTLCAMVLSLLWPKSPNSVNEPQSSFPLFISVN